MVEKPSKSVPGRNKRQVAEQVVKSVPNSLDEQRADRATRSKSAFRIVAIGSSAGGLEAITALFQRLGAETGLSFVYISHLDPSHESILTSLLAKRTGMPVHEVQDGMTLEPNHVYVIPPDRSMTLVRNTLYLARRAMTPADHAPIDNFMKSLAQDQKERAIGVILSGTASDGTAGLTAIKQAGGLTFAQKPESAKYDGMPRSAIHAGVVDLVLPPEEIAAMLARVSQDPAAVSAAAASAAAKTPVTPVEGLEAVLSMLRDRTGANFAAYKEATVSRRLKRRMAIKKLERLADYVRYLRDHPEEIDALYEDLLINVTQFFRDPKTFEKLKSKILPALLQGRSPKDPIRIWVPGCSTGEEAYSLAMLVFEAMSHAKVDIPVQVFGTDMSDRAIAVARQGVYPAAVAETLSAVRQKRFLASTPEGFKVTKALRDCCVFARQDITKDPPFSRLDLVSCRNVLIYLGKELQEKVLPIFHYALKPGGFLVLGKAETIETLSSLFISFDRKLRIYRKGQAESPGVPPFTLGSGVQTAAVTAAATDTLKSGARRPNGPREGHLREEARRLLLDRYSPAAVVIDEKMEILEVSGDTSPYLHLTSGAANLNILKLIRRDLFMHMRAAVDLAKRRLEPIRRDDLQLKDGANIRRLSLEVIPMTGENKHLRRYLVVFKEESADKGGSKQEGKSSRGHQSPGVVARLRRELAKSQEHMQILMDERQTADEELQSANEELLSSMEELQSTNEELQTSHEELESTNEELTTVNEQLATRNRELTETGNDLSNLIASVKVPIVILTNDLRLRRSTPAADRVLGLGPADIGRHVSQLPSVLKQVDLEGQATQVMETLAASEIEAQDRSGLWYSIRFTPYRTEDDRIEGIVVAMFEIDRIKRSLGEAESARALSRSVVETVREPLAVLAGRDFRLLLANQAFYDTFGLRREAAKDKTVFELGTKPFGMDDFKAMIEHAASGRPGSEGFEFDLSMDDAATVILRVDAVRLELSGEPGTVLLLTMQNVTAFKQTERRLRAERGSMDKERAQAVLSQHKTEVELSQSLEERRALARYLIMVQEEERKRVARELHDDLSQRLAVLGIEAANLTDPKVTDDVEVGIVKVQEQITKVGEEVRRVAFELHPSIAVHSGVAAALRTFCKEFSKRRGIKIEFTGPKEIPPLKEEVALCLYRITQEALHNVSSHSGAATASVTLNPNRDHVLLRIKDDGKGFDVAKVMVAKGGLGLVSMSERARLVGATFNIESRPGHGTQIEVQAPIVRAV